MKCLFSFEQCLLSLKVDVTSFHVKLSARAQVHPEQHYSRRMQTLTDAFSGYCDPHPCSSVKVSFVSVSVLHL